MKRVKAKIDHAADQIKALQFNLRAEEEDGYKMSANYERALNDLVITHNLINSFLDQPNLKSFTELRAFNIQLKRKLQEEGRLPLDNL